MCFFSAGIFGVDTSDVCKAFYTAFVDHSKDQTSIRTVNVIINDKRMAKYAKALMNRMAYEHMKKK